MLVYGFIFFQLYFLAAAVPTLELKPQLGVYLFGDKVDLNCCNTDLTINQEFRFYKNGSEINSSPVSEDRCATYKLDSITIEDVASYQCRYWTESNGTNIESDISEAVNLSITEHPASPIITLHPSYPIYITGESVTLMCTPADVSIFRRIQYYREGKPFLTEDLLNTVSANVTFISAHDAAGNYSCVYWEETHGRLISSSISNVAVIYVTDCPSPPFISLSPPDSVYVGGEVITFSCSIPGEFAVKRTQFYMEGEEIHREDTSDTNVSFDVTTTSREKSVNYSCSYWINYAGRNIQSHQSSNITVTVIDCPSPPFISLSPPDSVYVGGEVIKFSCSIPGEFAVKRIQFYMEGEEIHREDTSDTNVSFDVTTTSRETSVNYSCIYWINNAGRDIQSHQSSNITVTVIVRPAPPSISLSPSHPVYIRRETINLMCSIPGIIALKSIQYYRNGKEIYKVDTNKTKMFTISTSDQKSFANYSCGYSINMYGRNIQSHHSSYVTVNVIDPLPGPYLEEQSGFPIYLVGDNLKLVCSALSDYSVTQFQIYFEEEEIVSINVDAQTSLSHGVYSISKKSVGNYSCQYQADVLGRNILSVKSKNLVITLTDPPSAPSVLLEPEYNIYVTGETLLLMCTEGSYIAGYTMYKSGQYLLSSKTLSFKLSNIQTDSNGSYTCTYNKLIHGRLVESYRSEPVNLIVIDPLPAPLLILGAPIHKVEDGYQTALNCSAPDVKIQRIFYFFKITAQSDILKPDINVTDVMASVLFNLGPINYAAFFCEYEEEVRGRKVRSRRSENLTVPLTEASLMSPPVIACIIGGLALLFCLALVIWFYIKNKKENKLNTFRFSWYWKGNQRPSDIINSCNLNANENLDKTPTVVEKAEEDLLNLANLTITDDKEEDMINPCRRFATFQSSVKHSEVLSSRTFLHRNILNNENLLLQEFPSNVNK